MGSEPADGVFSNIAANPPDFSSAEACRLAREHYGLAATAATSLVSERDQNFLLQLDDARAIVLKIASAEEALEVTQFQVAALRHIAERGASKGLAPQVIETQTGELLFRVTGAGRSHAGRAVTYLSGVPMEERRLTPSLCQRFGKFMAQLDLALSSFRHPGENQTLLWDMKQALKLRELLDYVIDVEARRLLASAFDAFEARALPRFEQLRWQVIHHDANPGNVLTDEHGREVSGIIDFGDMLYSPLLVELAVAAAYLRELDGDPLKLIVAFVAGYHEVTPLTSVEVSLLHDLIKTRLATSVVIMAWRSRLRKGDDAYLLQTQASEASALSFLGKLDELSNAQAEAAYVAACGLPGRDGRS